MHTTCKIELQLLFVLYRNILRQIKEIVMMPNMKKMKAHVHIVDHVVLCTDIQ